jgi:hypothetical protein
MADKSARAASGIGVSLVRYIVSGTGKVVDGNEWRGEDAPGTAQEATGKFS